MTEEIPDAFHGAGSSTKADRERAEGPRLGVGVVRDAALDYLRARLVRRHDIAKVDGPLSAVAPRSEVPRVDRDLALLHGRDADELLVLVSRAGSPWPFRGEMRDELVLKQIFAVSVISSIAGGIIAWASGLSILVGSLVVFLAIVVGLVLWAAVMGPVFHRFERVHAVDEIFAMPANQRWLALDTRTYWSLEDGGAHLRARAKQAEIGILLVAPDGAILELAEAQSNDRTGCLDLWTEVEPMGSDSSLETLIDRLRQPELYDGADVVVHQTHISVVFVAGDRAYKLKKPVSLGFVDYSTPARRREFCEAEVDLNRRLAPDVYLGVRSVVERDGALTYGPPEANDAIDFVVEMQRLDERDNFLSHLHEGTLEPAWLEELGRKMAKFHQQCDAGEIGTYGAFETVQRNALENFSQSIEQVGQTVSPSVFDRARKQTETALDEFRPLIEARDADGHTRDTHGDLRLEHVYRVDGEICVVDCIEFNDAFRFADPVADVAFLVMDLRIRWADELADAFCNAYFDVLPDGAPLLDFYVSYRSAVRAKVHGITAMETEVDAQTRDRSRAKSKAHWLFALSALAEPENRPLLVLVGGFPGTGKSTVARELEKKSGFVAIDSDHVRKELAGVEAEEDMRADHGEGIYTTEWTEKTYDECLKRAVEILENGGRVAISATFKDDELRERFLKAAHRLGVAGYFVVCELERDEVARRIAARTVDASDADMSVYDWVADHWKEPGEFVAERTHRVSTRTRETAHEGLSDLPLGIAR